MADKDIEAGATYTAIGTSLIVDGKEEIIHVCDACGAFAREVKKVIHWASCDPEGTRRQVERDHDYRRGSFREETEEDDGPYVRRSTTIRDPRLT